MSDGWFIILEIQDLRLKLKNFYFSKTFFDLIDEDIEYPHKFNSGIVTAVSLANDQIITTSKWTNFSLFSYKIVDWTESVIEFREDISNSYISSEQLLTVRHRESGR